MQNSRLTMTSFFIVFFCYLFLSSCADPKPLTGGAADKKAPKIDSTKYSSPNFQTNFKERDIILSFDEWVVLKDAYNQVLISPPMQTRPDIKLKAKSVVLRFKEPLLENTTYSIQFGEAIADYTEGNVADNLRFVFSTGDVIDSLRIKGQLTDAITGSPVSKTWVMLYDNLADSVPLTTRPLYISKTDENGFFSLENIREDSFRIFALKDQNANYKYDQPSEDIAFWEEPIHLTDSTQGAFKLRMFNEGDLLARASTKLIGKGELQIKFSREIRDTVLIRPLGSLGTNFKERVEYGKDTLLYWFANQDSDFKLLIELPSFNWVDTINVNPIEEDELPGWAFVRSSNKPAGKGMSKAPTKKELLTIHPKDPLRLVFSRPLLELDTTKMSWVDSAQQPIAFNVFLNEKEARFPILECKVPASPSCTLRVFPGALIDIWGESNPDTLLQVYKVLGEDDLGSIDAKVVGADSTIQYIIQLLDEGENILDEQKLFGQKEFSLQYKLMIPQKYTLKVIHDADKNGVFTNGSYAKKLQPELVTISKPIALRKGWENELKVDLSALLGGKKKGKGKGGT